MNDVPGRILAVDPGTKRIGYALSDDLQLMARPHEVWSRRGLTEDLQHIRELVDEFEVVEILVGLPLRLDGSESPSTARARALAEAIRAALPEMTVGMRDEALTTWEAEQQLIAEGVPPAARKAKVDAYAAAALLAEELEVRRLTRDSGEN